MRTSEQVQDDFDISCDKLSEGYTWGEVAAYINKKKGYRPKITSTNLHNSYLRLLKKVNIQRTIEDERERLIDNQRSIGIKALLEYERSKKKTVQKTEESSTGSENAFEKTKTVKTTKVGNPRFLEIYNATQKRIAELQKIDEVKGFDLNVFLDSAKLQDNGGQIVEPIRSESEAKDFGNELE